MNTKIGLTIFLLIVLSITTVCSEGALSVSKTITSIGSIESNSITWLHTDGKYLKTPSGQTIFLRGAAFGDLSWQTGWNGGLSFLELRINQYLNLANGKPNVIRCAITPLPEACYVGVYPWNATLINPALNTWSTTIHPETYDAAVDQLVNLAANKKIRIIIEFHAGFGYNSKYGIAYEAALAADPTPWINWNLHFVNRYKNNPVVTGFEIWNEPWDGSFGNGNTQQGGILWHNMAQQAVNAIRSTNPNALILVASASPFNFIDNYWFTNPLGQNVVYTWDTYYKHWAYEWIPTCYDNGNFPLGLERMTDYLYRVSNIGKAAMEYNMPVWGSEFGWYGNEWKNWEKQMADELDLLNQWETNWVVWWWWENIYNLGLANSNYAALSPQGQVWAGHLGNI